MDNKFKIGFEILRHYLIYLLLITSLLMIQIQCSRTQSDDSKDINEGKRKSIPAFFTSKKQEFQNDIINGNIVQSRRNAITAAVSNASPAVVGINVIQIKRFVQRTPFDNDPFFRYFFKPYEYNQKVKGLGSGFLISPDGYIITNEHVVHQATKIIITSTDKKQYDAELIGSDEKYDVALLKIEGKNFSYIPLGNSDDIIIGEWVIALGNPFGLFNISSKPTVTVGVVSASNMDFKGNIAITGRSYTDMIQTDAAINGGNSGGPLVNSFGECIGINTFIFSGSQSEKISIGIGFAIPINRAKEILPELKEIGKVDRSFTTGLEVKDLSTIKALQLGISTNDGVVISRISKGTPADKADLNIGDIIVMINSRRVGSTYDVKQIINRIDVKEKSNIELVIYRNEKLKKVKLRLGKPEH